MIELNLRDRKPVNYTQEVVIKLDEMESLIEKAKTHINDECPYEVESYLYQLKTILRETTEMVNKTADYYEVASELSPNKEDIILTNPLEPRN